MFYTILIILELIISILMVVAILMQSSKGGGLAGIAGTAFSSSLFGGRTAAGFLQKATTILAALFMVNCLAMAMISKGSVGATSVTQQAVRAEAPASPVPQIPGGTTVEEGTATEPAPGKEK